VRLWSLHPRYLDSRGLVALWREALLAQAVLHHRTKGYKRHPQLDRFRRARAPVGFIAAYLRVVRDEASRRGYEFDPGRIARAARAKRAMVTRGQLDWERRHLLAKLRRRDPSRPRRSRRCGIPGRIPFSVSCRAASRHGSESGDALSVNGRWAMFGSPAFRRLGERGYVGSLRD